MSIQQQAEFLLSGCYILDTETTGLDGSAEIVEISIIDESGNVVLDTLIKPLNPIPSGVTAIHGITNEMVADAPCWPAVYHRVMDLISSRPLVIYNADYDLRMLDQTSALYSLRGWGYGFINVWCAMNAYAEFYGEWDDHRGKYRWQRLGNAAAQQGVIVEGKSHRALADCRMTLGLLKAMAGASA